MLKHSTRRWLAGLGVAGAFVAASATPAVAAPAAQVELYFQNMTLAPGSPGKSDALHLFSDRPTVLHDVAVRYDYRSLVGKVTIAAQHGDCTTPEEGVLLCKEHFPVSVDDLNGTWTEDVTIVPTDKAAVDDSGDLKISLQVAGKGRGSYTSRIRIGEGVDLAGGPNTEFTVKPGGAFEAPLTVVNVGEKPVKDVVAWFDLDYSIRTKDRFSNCFYVEDHLIACLLDEEIPAGEGRTATLNFQLGKDTYAPGHEYGNARFLTYGDFEDLFDVREEAGARAAKRGSGPKLTLRDAPTKVTRAAQTDTDPTNNFTEWQITVSGDNGADLEAIGAKLTGKAGDVVAATVGFRNNGPATLDYLRTDMDVTYVDVTVPTGTTAVEVPFECAPRKGNANDWDEPGKPGGREYRCYPGPIAPAGEELTGEFRLRIDKVIANATGLVKVNVPCECDGGFYKDLKPANDTAKILVNAAAGDGGQGGGDGDDDGGTLPITGTSIGLVAGIGALLLVAGVGGYLVAKRRRTRFVA
ncbi:LPXTG cell wall anchor domain-containing protein [Micromonospora olivasterospora]|uniref:LPXTG-motif cell wall-anchored protein n=1 Tax=Micromonospora olivasterospora TaxID=1880 RepID=A0A562I9R8_MICOL|nr:LPXTG cell wall anchor domain-containing protein [Micromonospora olivasterospora]TWH67632.1 LPXTG-motif cell wall-anchored protein [Micromonospora olivasterospora]